MMGDATRVRLRTTTIQATHVHMVMEVAQRTHLAYAQHLTLGATIKMAGAMKVRLHFITTRLISVHMEMVVARKIFQDAHALRLFLGAITRTESATRARLRMTTILVTLAHMAMVVVQKTRHSFLSFEDVCFLYRSCLGCFLLDVDLQRFWTSASFMKA